MSLGKALVTHQIYSHLSAGVLRGGGNKDQLFAESEVSLKSLFSLCVLAPFQVGHLSKHLSGFFSLFFLIISSPYS